MRSIAIGCFILLSAVAGLSQVRGTAPLDPSASAQIDGVVIDDKTGQPLANVAIAAVPISTISDSLGRFHKEGVKPGTFRLSATLAGYGRARPSQDRRVPGNSGVTVTVVAGQHLQDLLIHMLPSPIVTGRIADPQGRAIVGAQILPFRQGYDDDGKLVSKFLGGEKTNDLGEFRLTSLDPGDYGFKAEPASRNSGLAETTNLITNYSSVYYPGTPDPLKATALRLEAGVETRLGTLVVNPMRGFSLHLTLNSETGLSELLSIRIRRQGDSNSNVRAVNLERASRVETEITELSPGTYELLLAGSSGSALRIDKRFEIGQGDVSLSLTLPKAVPLKARAMKKNADGHFQGVPGVEIEFPWDNFTGTAPPAVVNRSGADGVFGPNPNVGHVEKIVRVRSVPPGFFVTSIRSDGHDILSEGLEVRDVPQVEITVMVDDGAGVVRGTVTDKKGVAVPGATIALIPDDRAQSALYVSSTADGNGKFNVQSGPGNFRIYAWREMDGGAYRNPDFMKPYDAQGQAVRIERNGDLSMNPNILD